MSLLRPVAGGEIGVLRQDQGRRRAEPGHDRPQQIEFGQRIARSLEEQHRDIDLVEMVGARRRGLAGRVEREGEEDQPAHARQLGDRLGLRGHASAEGFAAGEQRQFPRQPRRLGYRRAHGCLREGGRVGALRAALPVGDW